MFQIVLQRLLHPMRRIACAGFTPRGTHTQTAHARLEVCPPAAHRHTMAAECASRRERLGHWIAAAWSTLLAAAGRTGSSKVMAKAAPLAAAGHEFAHSLSDIRTQQADITLHRIRVARSLHELWHLRPEVFNLVSRHHDQTEAARRLALLNRHFPTRAPRSGFGTLTGSAPREDAP